MSERRDVVMRGNFTEDEAEKVRCAAEKCNMKPSEYIRLIALKAADSMNNDSGKGRDWWHWFLTGE